MLVNDIINYALHYLQEDIEHPEFWTKNELRLYLSAGIQDFLDRTDFQLNERRLPLALTASGENKLGWFKVPYDEVQKIKRIYWRDDNGVFKKLNISDVADMDREFKPDWRDTENKSSTPTHAVFYGGETGDWALSDTGEIKLSRAGAKLRLYPIPDYSDEEIARLSELSTVLDSGNYPYFVDEEFTFQSVSGDNVTSYEESIDGDPTLTQDEVVVDLEQMGEISKTARCPWIFYVPNYSAASLRDNVNLPFPDNICMALVDFVTFKAYQKGGYTTDPQRGASRYRAYDHVVKNSKKHDVVERTLRRRGNPMFIKRKRSWG